jgi:hypothetical protein
VCGLDLRVEILVLKSTTHLRFSDMSVSKNAHFEFCVVLLTECAVSIVSADGLENVICLLPDGRGRIDNGTIVDA